MKNPQNGLLFLSLFFLVIYFYGCSIPDKIPEKCPLDNPNCDTKKFPKDNKGKYRPKELVLSFPLKADLVTDSINGIPSQLIDINFIKATISNANNKVNKTPIPFDSISVETCICDEHIFLINSNFIIGSETNVAEAANNQEEIRREGGVFSLNYIIENSNKIERIPLGIVRNNPIPELSDTFSTNKNNPIVAILDSGIDFSKFDGAYDGIYGKRSNEQVCGIFDDNFGYNFIGPDSPNNNIQDLNGHGTIVSLTMKSRLESFPNVEWNDQRMLTVKVLDECGNGTIFSTTCGLAYAREKKANIINCSWGIYFNDIQLQRAIEQIPSQTAIICSAGNDKRPLSGQHKKDCHYPSGYAFDFDGYNLDQIANAVTTPPQPYIPMLMNEMSNVYEVQAIDYILNYPCSSLLPMSGTRAPYSNYRDGSFTEPANNVQLIIPGNPCPLNVINGTSFAAPALSAGLIHAYAASTSYTSIPPTRAEIKNLSLNIQTNKCFTKTICN